MSCLAEALPGHKSKRDITANCTTNTGNQESWLERLNGALYRSLEAEFRLYWK